MEQNVKDVLQLNPFEHSSEIKEQLKAHKTLAVFDFDRTLTSGNKNPSQQELKDQEDVWSVVAQANAIDACISARSRAMMMSQKCYEASLAYGFDEPRPRLYKNAETNIFEYRDPATIPFFQNAVDRKIIASFGGGIMVKNGSGYRVDKAFEHMLERSVYDEEDAQLSVNPTETTHYMDPKPVHEIEVPSSWRLAAMTFVVSYCQEFRPFLSNLENKADYIEGKNDVAPLPFRLQFDFVGDQGFEAKEALDQIVREAKQKGDLFARRIRIIDESRINEKNPEQSRWTTYWVPWYGTKEYMFNRILTQSAAAAGYPASETELFYAGDSPTDLRIGLFGGGGTETKFLLPTDSFLAPYLIGKRKRYGSVNLSWLFGGERFNPRLVPTGRQGEYRLEHKFLKRMRGGKSNLIVIADERYKGMTPPGSVASFLEEYMLHKHSNAVH